MKTLIGIRDAFSSGKPRRSRLRRLALRCRHHHGMAQKMWMSMDLTSAPYEMTQAIFVIEGGWLKLSHAIEDHLRKEREP